jgi:predicted RNA binding protein YcfA (HicA-like mRNA interferase family)
VAGPFQPTPLQSFIPGVKADDFPARTQKVGFSKSRQTRSHERWLHLDGRSTTIPVHGGQEIGPPLFHRIISQLGIDEATFSRLR